VVPHLPQFAGSVLVSTQALLQNVEHELPPSVVGVPESRSSSNTGGAVAQLRVVSAKRKEKKLLPIVQILSRTKSIFDVRL
jgi:hypothetical protein